jgi:hypothetical protein
MACDSGLEFPHLDRALPQRYLDYWTRIGFLTHGGAVDAKHGPATPTRRQPVYA